MFKIIKFENNGQEDGVEYTKLHSIHIVNENVIRVKFKCVDKYCENVYDGHITQPAFEGAFITFYSEVFEQDSYCFCEESFGKIDTIHIVPLKHEYDIFLIKGAFVGEESEFTIEDRADE